MDLRSLAGALCLVASGLGACVADYRPIEAEEAAAYDLTEYDPFTIDMPALILDAKLRQDKGRLLSVDMQHELYDYGQAHADDPRPWLLLARDSMAQRWAGFAVRQYGLALSADARVATTAGVLDDVLSIAIDYTGVEERDANALLEAFWGATALPAVERELAQMVAEGREQESEKLAAVRATLLDAKP
jgi:hypothetical protein